MVAWPTVLLGIVLPALFALVCYLGVQGAVSLWGCLGINSIILYACLTPLHEASHGNIAGKDRRWTWLNHLIGFVNGLVLMHDYRAFRYLHRIHHRETNDDALDPDRWVKVQHPLNVLFRCFTIVPFYFYYFFRTVVFKPSGPGNVGLAVYVLGMYAAIVCFTVWSGRQGYWAEVAMLWLLPHWIGSAIIIYLFAFVPHRPHTSKERYLNSRIHSISGLWGWVANAVYIMQNYHLVHHLYPRIPFYNYRPAYQALAGDLRREGARIED